MRLQSISLLPAVVLMVSCSSPSDSLTERHARQLSSLIFPDHVRQSVLTGEIRFWNKSYYDISGSPVMGPVIDLPLYRELAKLGLITMANERDLSSQFSGWEGWFQLTQQGITYIATISATEKMSKDKRFDYDPKLNEFKFNVANQRVKEVLAIEPYSSNTDKYSLISLTVEREPIGDDLSRIYETSKETITNQKARLLYRYDLFKKDWVLDTWDITDLNREFRQNSVAAKLGTLKPGDAK